MAKEKKKKKASKSQPQTKVVYVIQRAPARQKPKTDLTGLFVLGGGIMLFVAAGLTIGESQLPVGTLVVLGLISLVCGLLMWLGHQASQPEDKN